MSLHRSSRGFTLIELLVVIAIIGIIAVLLVPNLIDTLHKSKQKRTMGDIKLVGTAMMSWLTDQAGGAAAAGQNTVDLSAIPIATQGKLEEVLTPAYIQEIPERDGWQEPYDFRLDFDDPNGLQVLAARSFGRDRQSEGDEYTVGPFVATEYDRDLVWVDGGFVRWPQSGLESDGGGSS